VNGTETWQIYGLGGELLAEYAASAAPASPQKEYGYRNGELLITAEGQQQQSPATSASFVTTDTTTQGDWKGVYGADGYNVIGDSASYPAYAQVSATGESFYTWAASTGDVRAPLKVASSTDRIAACWYSGTNFTIDINLTDGNTHKVALYTLDWDGNNSRNGTIEILNAATNAVLDTRALNTYSSGKYFVWQMRGHVKIRLTHISPPGWNQVVSGLFFDSTGSGGSPASIHWLVTDQLGTPRMVFDQTGSLTVVDQNGQYVSGMTRHDYLPFGEEVPANFRTGIPGYAASDNVRQKFTQKERDSETGLDYFLARYYSSIQGRFTSADLPLIDQHVGEPQTWNLYTYSRNNPLRYTDPDGRGPMWEKLKNSFLYNRRVTDAELAAQEKEARDFLIAKANKNADHCLYIIMGEEGALFRIDPQKLTTFYTFHYFELLNEPTTREVELPQEVMDNAINLAGTSPALQGDPYHPEEVAKRNRPDYKSNPAHDPQSPHFNPRKTPEPPDAANVYRNSVRGGMGTWYGRGANGQIYRFFSDNAGGERTLAE
jgi:RHS repeat-associated protein